VNYTEQIAWCKDFFVSMSIEGKTIVKIYGRASGINVMKVMWMAAELNLIFEHIEVGGSFGGTKTPEYLALNPTGTVPTVVDGDHAQWESNSCVRYLADREGATRWYPEDLHARGRANTWMDWAASSLHPQIFILFWQLIRTPERDRDQAAMETARQKLCDFWGILETQLAKYKYVAGEEITIGDIPAAVQAYRWHALDIERPVMPLFDAWYKRITERPAFQENVMLPLVYIGP
jgi:glutathione S-transferase